MVMLHAFTFASYFIDHVAMLTIIPIMFSITIQYFFMSLASAKIQDAHASIGTSIYSSKWYWMSVNDQKTILQMMMMSTKTKALQVGLFGDSNLERFTSVRN